VAFESTASVFDESACTLIATDDTTTAAAASDLIPSIPTSFAAFLQ
jgi:hypothetical protein